MWSVSTATVRTARPSCLRPTGRPSTLADKVHRQREFFHGLLLRAKAIEVEVDPGTGALKIAEIAASQDLGKAINPLGPRPRSKAGAYGAGLCHERRNRSGMKRAGCATTTCSTTASPPRWTPLRFPHPDRDHRSDRTLRGQRGGRDGHHRDPDALVSAVHDAVGVWVTDLPVTPEKILLALKKKKKEGE